MVADELRLQFRITVAPEVLARAWTRMTPTSAISLESLEGFVDAAQQVGFVRAVPDLARLLAVPP
jgi:NitT/TauT family transport system substrate-binding protein